MLFKTVNDVKEYFSFLAQTDISFIKPHIERAEQKYIRKYLGKLLYDTLNTYVAGATQNNEANNNLLAYIRPALGAFAVKDAVSQLNLILTDNGFATTQTNSLTPASKQRTDDLKAELSEAAWDGIENLLQFLEENKTTYPEWVSGEGYTQAHRNIINTAIEFFNLLDMDISRLTFIRLRAVMDNVEQLIIAKYISIQLLTEIKAQITAANVNANNNAILPNLKRALANLSIAQYIPEEISESQSVADKYNINDARRKQYEVIGMQYLGSAIDVIVKNPENYPQYMASSLYTIPATTPFENLEENETFVFGG